MSINTISFSDKSNINTSAVPRENKVVADDVNEIKSVVNTNANLMGDVSNLDTSSTNIVDAVNEVREGLYQETTLWTNSNPTQSFASQDITLSSGDYDDLRILYYDDLTSPRLNSVNIPKVANGDKSVIQSIVPVSTSMYVSSRTILFNTSTSITFGNNTGMLVTSANLENDNSKNIPYMIIGIKRIGDD